MKSRALCSARKPDMQLLNVIKACCKIHSDFIFYKLQYSTVHSSEMILRGGKNLETPLCILMILERP